ncbi:MAG: hypothetical protein WBX25_13320 [Rhodomicrobium sp.]
MLHFSHFPAARLPIIKSNRRNGHPAQNRISKKMLKPYLKIVRARIRRNPDSPAWPALDKRWLSLVAFAKGLLAAPGAMNRHRRIAAQEVVKLASLEPRLVVETTMAMMVFQEFEPHQFKTDRAFWIQLARQVRSLTDLTYCRRFRASRGEICRIYKEIAPDAARMLGHWLTELLGVGGLHIARMEIAEAERRAQEKAGLHEALGLA